MAFKRIWHQAEVLAALDAGATVVTSGERLARAVRLAHGEGRQAAGAIVWERPDVMSYGGFLNRLYDSAVNATLGASANPPPKRISEAVAEILWEEAIHASPTGEGLLQVTAAAREAQRAWNLMWAYRIPPERIAAAEDADARQFAAWSGHFRQKSREQGWLEDARLADWLATRVREGALPVPAEVVFAGFDVLTPQQLELTESLRFRSGKVQLLAAQAPAATGALRTLCDDTQAEMHAAAQWARALLDKDPTGSIGIVVRDLSTSRTAMTRALDDALCPPASAGREIARPYDLFLGLSLDSFPVVHVALAALELLQRRTPFESVSLLLRSAFLAGAESERHGRARMELTLRQRVSEDISLQTCINFATAQGGLPGLVSALQALAETVTAMPARQSLSAWAGYFADALARCGWPGERALDSREYQTVTAFHDLIGELVHLDAALGAVPFGEALTRLKRLAGDSIFQPAGEQAPVQVLGLLETAGLRFEHLWIMGLSDEVWPTSPRPAAFIPPRLQREYKVPHAGAAIELAFARQITQRLLASAAHVVASTPASQGDAELRASPLIAHLPVVALEGVRQAHVLPYRQQLQLEHGRAAEAYIDMQGPGLRPGEQTRGGTQLIRSQAACPFQAFAWHRLGARPLDEPELGPDALERGSLVHEVLQAVWARLKDHAALAALDGTGRRALAAECAVQAVAIRTRELPEVYTRRVSEIERERLTQLVSAWLDKEAMRPPFKVVESEAEHTLTVGPLKLKARVDRIDELPDGGRVILDYKTGRVSLQSWLDTRPDEPQLPLYAIGNPTRLAGLAFACLKPGEMRYLGLAERDGVAAGVEAYAGYKHQPQGASDWAALMEFWQRNLTALAEEYAAGEARVAPKSPMTCVRCHLSTLCRIDELGGPGSFDEEEADDEA